MGNINDLLKPSKKKKKAPISKRTVQETLPYIECYEDGMMMIEDGRFSKTLEIEDISFKTKADDEQEAIYDMYLRFLNTLTPNEDLFLTFVNYKEDTTEALVNVLPEPKGDKYDVYRAELSDMIKQKLNDGRKNIKTKKYATLTCEAPSVDEAHKKMASMEQEFCSQYRKITKTSPKPLDMAAKLELLDFILNSNRMNFWFEHDQKGNTSLDINAMRKKGLSTKDIIAPEGIKFNGSNFVIDERFGQAVYLDSIANWMNTNFIADLSEVNFESCFTIHISAIPQEDSIKLIHNQSVNITAEIIQKTKDNKSGYIPKALQDTANQIEDLQEDLLNRDQKLFYMSLVMVYFGDSEKELKDNAQVIKNIGSKYMSRFANLIMQQERGLCSALPLGLDKTYTKRLLTTESLGIFLPFDEVNVLDKGGFYYGSNSINKSLIIYDRLKALNYNGLILGTSGAGKSFSAKREMTNVLLNKNADIYILDPDGEYTPLADEFEGSVIRLAPGNGVYINPFDLDMDTSYDKDSNPITAKTDFICGMLETMLGSGAVLTPTQKSIVDRCIHQIYKPYLEHLAELPPDANGKRRTIDRDYCPTMQNLFDALLSQPQIEAQNLALIMETYTTGTFDTFAHRTNVDLTNRMIVYDISKIGSNLKELALKVCTNDIWNKMMENRRQNKWTWFYIDEFHLLLNNPSTAAFLISVWKRARKWWGVPTGITQDVGDLLNSNAATAIINNSSFIYMLNQAMINREILAQILHLTENDMEYITNVDPGSGIIYTGKQVIPFTDHFPEKTKLYKVMTTKPADGDNLD